MHVAGTMDDAEAAQHVSRQQRRHNERTRQKVTARTSRTLRELSPDSVMASASNLNGRRALARAATEALEAIRGEPCIQRQAQMLALVQQLNANILHACEPCTKDSPSQPAVSAARAMPASTSESRQRGIDAARLMVAEIYDTLTIADSCAHACTAAAQDSPLPTAIVLPGIADWHGAMDYGAVAGVGAEARSALLTIIQSDHGPCRWIGDKVVDADGDTLCWYSHDTLDWEYVGTAAVGNAVRAMFDELRSQCFSPPAIARSALEHFENNRIRALQNNRAIDDAYRSRLRDWARRTAQGGQAQVLSAALHTDVDSGRAGRNTPIALHGVRAVHENGEVFCPIDASMAMGDTGAGTYLIGMRLYNKLAQNGFARRAVRLKSSILSVKGIAGVGYVPFHADITLELGGHRVRLHDVPVLDGHDGLLLGNDFNGECLANYDFAPRTRDGVEYDGRLILQRACTDEDGRARRDVEGDLVTEPISEPIYFTHRAPTASAALVHSASVEEALEAALDAPDRIKVNELAAPLAYCPEVTRVAAWSQAMIEVRLPAAAIEGHDVAILPLLDDRAAELGLEVAPSMVTPTADGKCHIRVVNTTLSPINIDALQPVARFIIDPRVADQDLEFTVDEILESIHIDAHISASDREEIREMLKTRRRLFASKLGHAHGVGGGVKIDTPLIDSGERPPPFKPNRRCSPAEYDALKATIDKQIRQRLLVKVQSPYNALPIMIRKPDGTFRCVLDYRNLNLSVVRSSYPLPSVEQNLSILGKANLFSVADLLMGFHQLELHPSSVKKTAFSTPWGQYAYVRLPMGLTSSPGIFQSVVDSAFRGLPPGMAIAYMDDVAIPTAGNMKQHMQDVGRVFDRLIEAGFTVRADKVHIGLREIPYLGFLAGAGGTRPNPERTAALLEITAESMGTDPQKAARFAGMIQFYHRFIPRLHRTLGVFHELKAKGADAARVMLSCRFKASVAVLAHQLAHATLLSRPDFEKAFYVYHDAATLGGAGAVLMQRENEDDPDSVRPICFWSCRFSDAERGMGVRDQECFGMFKAITEWRPYLLGSRVVGVTDHRSLFWLMSSNHPVGSKVWRWVAELQQYDLTVQVIPGAKHVVADCMSRIFQTPVERTAAVNMALGKVGCSSPFATVFFTGSTVQIEERRVIVVFVAHRNGSPCVLLEHQGETWSFMSTSFAASCTPRQQLFRHIATDLDSWSAVALEPAIARAVYLRPSGKHTPHVFVATIRPLELRSLSSTLMWMPFDGNTAVMLADDTDFHLCTQLFAFSKNRIHWIPHYRDGSQAKLLALRTAFLEMSDTPDGAATVALLSNVQRPIVSFVDTAEDGHVALSALHHRCRQTGALALDAEGFLGNRKDRHMSLLQLAADAASEDEQQIAFIFDVHECPELVSILQPLLTDTAVMKVAHAAHGDCITVLLDWSYQIAPVFDTALAHTILKHGRISSYAGLAQVLHTYTPHVALTHKENVQFLRYYDIFTQRPLPQRLFEYAYEDVLYLCSLYSIMKPLVRLSGLKDFVQASMMERTSGYSLPRGHPQCVAPRGVATAVTDGFTTFCIRSRQGTFALPIVPWCDIAPCNLAPHAWTNSMGVPSRGELAIALTNRVGRCIQVGDTMVSIIWVASCSDLLKQVSAAAAVRNNDAVCANLFGAIHTATTQDAAIFQYLRVKARHRQQGGRTARAALETVHLHGAIDSAPLPNDAGLPLHRVLAVTEVHGTTVSLRLGFSRRVQRTTALRVDAVAVAFKAKHADIERAAIMLHDDTHVFAMQIRKVKDKERLYELPSLPLRPGLSPEQIAEDALDLYGGTALRKGADTSDCMPITANIIDSACKSIKRVGTFEGTQYFAVRIPCFEDIRMSLHAARAACNAYRLTATNRDRFSGFRLLRMHSPAGLTQLGSDRAAIAALVQSTQSCAAGVATASVQLQLHHTHISDIPLDVIGRIAAIVGDAQFRAVCREWAAVEPQSVTADEDRALFLAQAAVVFHLLVYRLSNQARVATGRVTRSQARASSQHSESSAAPNTDPDAPSPHAPHKPGASSQHSETTHSTGTQHRVGRRLHTSDTRDLSNLFESAQHVSEQLPSELGHDALPSPTEPVALAEPPSQHSEPESQHSEPPNIVGGDGETQEDEPVGDARRRQRSEPGVDVGDNNATTGEDAVGNGPPAMPTDEELIEAQRADPGLKPLIAALEMSPHSEEYVAALRFNEFALEVKRSRINEYGILVRRSHGRERVYLPYCFREQVVLAVHARQGHFGSRIAGLVCERYYWNTIDVMRKEVASMIHFCDACRLSKIPRHGAGAGIIMDNGSGPFDSVEVDFMAAGRASSEGHDGTISFGCRFTRCVKAEALIDYKTITSTQYADIFVNTIVRHFGVPSWVLSDNDSVLVAAFVKDLAERLGMDVRHSTSYRHQTVGLIERWHSTLRALLRTYWKATGSTEWHVALPLLELAYNTTVHSTTGYSPFFLIHLRQVRLPVDFFDALPSEKEIPRYLSECLNLWKVSYHTVCKQLRRNQLAAKAKHDLKHDTQIYYKPGDRVIVVRGVHIDGHMPKGEFPVEGPYTVMQQLENGNYKLRADFTGRAKFDEFNIERLLPFDPPPRRTPEQLSRLIADGGSYPIEAVVGCQVITEANKKLGHAEGTPRLLYRLRWLDWPRGSDAFREAEYLTGIAELVCAYHRQHGYPAGFEPAVIPDESLGGDEGQPPVAEAAAKVPHFRFHPHPRHAHDTLHTAPAPSPPPAAPQPSTVQPSRADTVLRACNKFKAKTRVRVHYPLEKQWYVGTVVRSALHVPRNDTDGSTVDWHIDVVYDDPRWHDEDGKPVVYTHGIAGSEIEVVVEPQPQGVRQSPRLQSQVNSATRRTITFGTVNYLFDNRPTAPTLTTFSDSLFEARRVPSRARRDRTRSSRNGLRPVTEARFSAKPR